MNLKWVGRTCRKIQRFCRKNETMIQGIIFIALFFGVPIIGGLLH